MVFDHELRGQSSGAGSLGPASGGASGNCEALLSRPRSWGENSLLKRSDSMTCWRWAGGMTLRSRIAVRNFLPALGRQVSELRIQLPRLLLSDRESGAPRSPCVAGCGSAAAAEGC